MISHYYEGFKVNIETIFKNVEETHFIEKLSQQDNLKFIGDIETIEYLRKYINSVRPKNTYEYHIWSTVSPPPQLNIHPGNSIIVASVKNEDVMSKQVSQFFAQEGKPVTVLRLFTDVFVSLMAGKVLLEPSEEQIKQPKLSYAIITTPRSGSTFLCSALQSTGLAGYPTEHLRQACAVLGLYCQFDIIQYLHILMQYKVTKNDVFGTKIISHFLETFQKKVGVDLDSLSHSFSKYIYLIRKDKVAQAVSIFLAHKTDVWHVSSSQQKGEYESMLEKIEISESDLNAVHQWYSFLEKQELYLERFFHENNLSPLVIEYEKVVEQPEFYLNHILQYIGVLEDGHTVTYVPPDFKKLRSGISEKIIQQYKAVNF